MRRTKLQRALHRRVIEEWLVEGLPAGQIVRSLIENFSLTPRQARYDLAQVQATWRREDDALRQNRWKLRDLAIAADRCERDFRAALAAGDPRQALRVEKHRSKLLGLYDADRRRAPHVPEVEREAIIQNIESDLDGMYAEAPRNPDGSVVLTAYSRTPPPVNDERYREQIERPLARGPSLRRQERIADLRAALATGVRIDRLEAAARERFRLSPRQIRSDMRLLVWQLEDDGHRLHQGSHELQALPLALRRRERIAELAQSSRLAPRDESISRSEMATLDGRVAGAKRSAAPAAPPAGAPSEAAALHQRGVMGHDDPASAGASLRSDPATHGRKKIRPDDRLVADIEIDRCKLLGLYARQRPKAEDDDLHWSPPEAPQDDGRIGNPPDDDRETPSASDYSTRPRDATARAHYDNERMTEIELAFLDAQNGIRHTVAELLPDLFGRPRHKGRAHWKPPPNAAEDEYRPSGERGASAP